MQLSDAERERLDALLGVASDPDLAPADVDARLQPVAPAWATAFEDARCGVRISVAFVADPSARDTVVRELMAELASEGELVATNGGMVFLGTTSVDGGEVALRRLRELAERFSGRE